MSSQTKPSLADVAAAAGCSESAVSLVLSNKHHGRISPELAEVIKGAAIRMGYRPNRAARQLATGASDVVAAVVPDPGNPFYAHLLAALVADLGDRHQLSLIMPGVGETLSHAAERAAQLDPAIIVVSSPTYEFQPPSPQVPVLLLDAAGLPTDECHIDLDMNEYGRVVGEHLGSLGHRRVVWFGLDRRVPSLDLRREALGRTLRSYGAAIVDYRKFADIDPSQAAAEFARQWMGWREQGVTAVVCGDDLLAYGVLIGAHEMDVEVPYELSVVGAGDLWYSRATMPPLTTVDLRASELGSLAAQIARDLVDGDTLPQSTSLSVGLVIRSSTSAAIEPVAS